MKKQYIIFLLAGSLTVSCTDDSEKQSGTSTAQIVFTPAVTGILRGSDTSIETLKPGILVNAYQNGSYSNPYFTNTLFTYNASQNLWISSPPEFWNSSLNLDFFAYYPTDLPVESSAPDKFTYTVQPESAQQKDVVVAYKKGQTEEDYVPMQFQHAMSKLCFRVTTKANSGLDLKLESIAVKNIPMTASFQYDTSASNPPYFTTSGYAGTGDATVQCNNYQLTASTSDVSSPFFDSLYIIPHFVNAWQYSADNSASLLDTETYINIAGVMSGPTDYQTNIIVPLAAITWQPGYCYIYDIVFGDYSGQSGGGGYTPDQIVSGKPLQIIVPIQITVTVVPWIDGGDFDIDLGA